MSNNSEDNGSIVSKELPSIKTKTSTAFTFLPPESAKNEIKTKSNTKNDIFQFGPARNSVVNSIDKIVEDVGKLDVSDVDDRLFQDPPPPKEECPICMLLLPHANGLKGLNSVYQPCCGKVICCGCTLVAVGKMQKGELKRCCPYCRLPNACSDEEVVQRMEERTKMNDANACSNLGCGYRQEFWGLTRNVKVELELLNKAVELGNLEAHLFIATAYQNGDGVEKDMEKAIYHWELAAIGGHEIARHNLGWAEQQKGNMQRAMKHHMISARGGYDDSLKQVGIGYKRGYVTKDEYASTLRAYQKTLDKMRSEQRTLSAQLTSESVVG